jgi:uncharacterized membrane protein YuzA (DUF378 family)
LAENIAISILPIAYPAQFNFIATVAGYLTSLKHALYALSIGVAALAWARALVRRA